MKQIKGKLSKYNENYVIIVFIILCFFVSRLSMLIIYYLKTGSMSIPSAIEWFNYWDAGWYRTYAEGILSSPISLPNDINNGQAGYAFFPLYPVICGLVGKIFPFVSLYKIGSCLSSIFFMVSEFFAYKYLKETRDNRFSPFLYIFIMSFGPYSFYFSIMYTEALFLMLLVMCFYFMQKERYILMGICGALLSATRNVGVFFCFVLLTFWIIKCLNEHRESKFIPYFAKYTLKNSSLLLGAALIPLGLFAYMVFLKIYTGDILAFVHVQHAWGKTQDGIINVLFKELVQSFPPTFWGINMVVSMVLIGYLFYKKRFTEAVFPFIVFVIAGMSSAASIARYMIGSFGVVLAITDYISKRSKAYRWVILSGLAAYELLLIGGWIIHSHELI